MVIQWTSLMRLTLAQNESCNQTNLITKWVDKNEKKNFNYI